MPVVDLKGYQKMLAHAKKNHFAYPAVNVTSTETANAVLLALKNAKSDGIIQVSTGGGEFASGQGVKDKALGAIAIAQHVHLVAARYDINVALHTDHCQPKYLDSFLLPLVEETERRRKAGLPNLFNSHMFDGSELGLKENLEKSKALLERMAKSELILEVEIGVVGGEEDGHDTSHAPADKLYTSPEDMVATHAALKDIGPYLLAATFGNVHGVYKPGNVKLKPTILRDGQAAIAKAFGATASADLVFHGGSGTPLEEIRETLGYGVVKMNIDTDTQYTFTRPIVEHMFKNYDSVLKIDGEVGDKKKYDPRTYLKAAETGMAARIQHACEDLRSAGQTLGRLD